MPENDRRDGLLYLDGYSTCASLRWLLQTPPPNTEAVVTLYDVN